MSAFDTKFEAILRGKVEKVLSKKVEDVATGCPTFEKYREEVGYIRALKDVLGMVEKARAELIQGR